ncbi:MAG: ABC transporter ATP-binding protein [Bacteroides sp.]|nr:ABC transporter ATP-binding protein [Bacteroides sp.]
MNSPRHSLRWVNRLMTGFRHRLLWACLNGTAQTAASLAFVFVCKQLVDNATGRSTDSMGLLILLLVATLLGQLLFSGLNNHLEGKNKIMLQNRSRRRLFRSVMQSRWEGKESLHTGDTINRLEEDIRVTTECLCHNVPAAFTAAVQLTAASCFLFMMAPMLVGILLLVMPLCILAGKFYFRRMRALTAHIRSKDSHIQAHLQENLQHRLLVRTMGYTDPALQQLDSLQKELHHTTLQRLRFTTTSRTAIQCGFMAGYSIAFLWGIFGLKDGSVTFGMMTAFLQLVGQIQRPILNLSHHLPAFVQAFTSVERLMELSRLPQEESGPAIRLQGAPGIRIDRLTYGYPDQETPVIRGLSHHFPPGSSTAIMGPTGIGKSTLIRLLLGLLQPREGSITLYDGRQEAPVSPLTRINFMYVPQGNSLMSGTIRQNLLLANPEATEEEMTQALHTATADFVLRLPQGLDTPCHEKGSGLSEGQAQRIAIARALLHPGGILILDEASSALDKSTEETLIERLMTHTAGRKTVIWITHREAVTTRVDSCLRMVCPLQPLT